MSRDWITRRQLYKLCNLTRALDRACTIEHWLRRYKDYSAFYSHLEGLAVYTQFQDVVWRNFGEILQLGRGRRYQ